MKTFMTVAAKIGYEHGALFRRRIFEKQPAPQRTEAHHGEAILQNA